MSSLVDNLLKKGLINPPKFLENTVQYEVMMGSFAYGVSNDMSDVDAYGFAIPPKHYIFPHLKGVIPGFDKQVQSFDQFQQHHVKDKDTKKEYDFSIYSIVKYFRLCADNNPNMIDSLFVPRRCIIHSTQVGEHVRENRKLFLHKGSWHKFKGYAYSQMHKIKIKNPEPGSKRYDMVQQYGYDLKFAYHVVRLMNEIEQILMEKDLDLERNREQLKAIRRGEWTQDQIESYFESKEKNLEELYVKSDLPHTCEEDSVKKVLLECLEIHFGNLDNCYKDNSKAVEALRQIANIYSKF